MLYDAEIFKKPVQKRMFIAKPSRYILCKLVERKNDCRRGRNELSIGLLVRNYVSILIQNTNLTPRDALRCVVRQCVNLIDIESEA